MIWSIIYAFEHVYTISQSFGTFGTFFVFILDKSVERLFYAILCIVSPDPLCHLEPCETIDKPQSNNLPDVAVLDGCDVLIDPPILHDRQLQLAFLIAILPF